MVSKIYYTAENENGQYLGTDGKKYDLLSAGIIVAPEGSVISKYKIFESEEAAREYFVLTKVENSAEVI